MPHDTHLVLSLVGGDPDAPAEVLRRAGDSTSTPLLVAAAVISGDLDVLDGAARLASTTRDRQLVVLARAHLLGEADLFQVLVRDHLSEHPDHLLASWIAGLPLPDS